MREASKILWRECQAIVERMAPYIDRRKISQHVLESFLRIRSILLSNRIFLAHAPPLELVELTYCVFMTQERFAAYLKFLEERFVVDRNDVPDK